MGEYAPVVGSEALHAFKRYTPTVLKGAKHVGEMAQKFATDVAHSEAATKLKRKASKSVSDFLNEQSEGVLGSLKHFIKEKAPTVQAFAEQVGNEVRGQVEELQRSEVAKKMKRDAEKFFEVDEEIATNIQGNDEIATNIQGND